MAKKCEKRIHAATFNFVNPGTGQIERVTLQPGDVVNLDYHLKSHGGTWETNTDLKMTITLEKID